MKTGINNFKRAYHEIGKMSFLLKKHGHDLFVRYSPHVEMISWELFINGWKDIPDNMPDDSGNFNIENAPSYCGVEYQILKLRNIIKGLLDENNKRT